MLKFLEYQETPRVPIKEWEETIWGWVMTAIKFFVMYSENAMN